VTSKWSIASQDSLLSIASHGSVLSIGSVASLLSVGSIGSVASVLGIGSASSAASAMSAASLGSVMSGKPRRRGRPPHDAVQRGTAGQAVQAVAIAVLVLVALRGVLPQRSTSERCASAEA
jgi:hypothetical protein